MNVRDRQKNLYIYREGDMASLRKQHLSFPGLDHSFCWVTSTRYTKPEKLLVGFILLLFCLNSCQEISSKATFKRVYISAIINIPTLSGETVKVKFAVFLAVWTASENIYVKSKEYPFSVHYILHAFLKLLIR